MVRHIYILLLLSFLVSNAQGELKALPWAEGHGRFTAGGRGHGLFFVTNTDNSGSGSFRQALANANTAGGGNIIFRTGGTITASSDISITGSNITVWGESASGSGIALYGASTVLTGENIIVTNLRFRGGDPIAGLDKDSFRIQSQSGSGDFEGYFIDHCSFSWSSDENFSIETGTSGSKSVDKVTLQNSIISEGFDARNAILWGRNITNVSILNNYFANTEMRSVRASTTPNVTFEEINNYIYGYVNGIQPTLQNHVSVIGNIFEDGHATQSLESIRFETCSSGNCPPSGITDWTGTQFYHADNKYNGGSATISSNVSSYIVGTRIVNSGYMPISSSLVKSHVLANAGARAWMEGVDALDAHIIADGVNGSTGNFPRNESQTTGLPTLSAGTPYIDSDDDGMADSWEIANFGDLSKTYNGTDLGGGYTNLEYFMFSLSGWHPDDPEIPMKKNEQKKAAATNILNW